MSVVPGSRLLGFGAALPDRVVTAAELGAPFGKPGEWVTTRTGITAVRRVSHPDEIVKLAGIAARDALGVSGRREADVDLVLTTSCSALPGPGGVALDRDLAPGAPRMSVNAACSGFGYALSTADSLIRSGAASTVLLVAAERMSALIDPSDLGTSIIFGDGAGAAVLVADPTGAVGIGPPVWGSDGGQAGLIDSRPRGGPLTMYGSQVFRWAVETVPDIALAACARAGVSITDIEVFVPHQANLRIIDAVVRRLGLGEPATGTGGRGGCVVADSVTAVGNTSAASIPIALSALYEQGRTRPGQLALLVGFGAGLTWAAQVVRLP